MHNAIIMCAGQAKRMGEELKQLTVLNGEHLIDRTIRQCKPLFDKLFIVPRFGVHDFHDRGAEQIVLSSHPETKAETILRSTYGFGIDRTTFLLGDVVWSSWALQQVIKPYRSLVFFGHSGPNVFTGKKWRELFALSVANCEYSNLLKACELEKGTMLWDLFEMISGKRREQVASSNLFCEIEDQMVDDIDTQEEAERMQTLLLEHEREPI
jgi:hypothetical protein